MIIKTTINSTKVLDKGIKRCFEQGFERSIGDIRNWTFDEKFGDKKLYSDGVKHLVQNGGLQWFIRHILENMDNIIDSPIQKWLLLSQEKAIVAIDHNHKPIYLKENIQEENLLDTMIIVLPGREEKRLLFLRSEIGNNNFILHINNENEFNMIITPEQIIILKGKDIIHYKRVKYN